MTTAQPIRVQLSRRKGRRKPDNTMVVARPTAILLEIANAPEEE